MNLSAKSVLGKRRRNKMGGGTNAELEAHKKLRTRKGEHIQTSQSPSKLRNGLLTPEPSTLADSRLSAESLEKKDIFPFMNLPAELRLHIYHMALVRSHPIVLHVPRALEKTEDAPNAPLEDVYQTPESAERTRTERPAPRTAIDPPLSDPVVPVILRLNQQIYKEARQLLYSENVFTLNLSSGIHTLSTLHQRSRSLIKHVVLTIPSHHDILDGFADLVRLGLRYCWGLKSFKIILQASLPDDGRVGGATSVYANAFHILRWLPRGCSVALEGCVSETVRKVVVEEGRLMNVLDEVSYHKRMLLSENSLECSLMGFAV
jgi:epsin